jgi:AraC-like DNA-binding protein
MLISRWSTDSLAPRDRWASVVEALGQAIVPISVSIDDPRDFEFHMSSMALDEGISVLHQVGSAHRSARGKRELARSDAHTYHFMINLASEWMVRQEGEYRLAAGEGILIDSDYMNDLELPREFEVIHVKMDEHWLQRWMPPDQSLAGRRFPLQPGLGAALNLFAAQLSPHLLRDSALSHAAVAEKFGALMAMAAHTGGASPFGHAGLCDQVRTVMAQRSAEPGLGAADVARDLHIAPSELHAALAGAGEVFADVLLRMRCEAGMRMLRSPSFKGFSLDEISIRAGFADAQAMLRLLPASGAHPR